MKNKKLELILNDLDELKNFCRDYGYKFNEADLYNTRADAWVNFQRFKRGQNFTDQWAVDAKRTQLA